MPIRPSTHQIFLHLPIFSILHFAAPFIARPVAKKTIPWYIELVHNLTWVQPPYVVRAFTLRYRNCCLQTVTTGTY